MLGVEVGGEVGVDEIALVGIMVGAILVNPVGTDENSLLGTELSNTDGLVEGNEDGIVLGTLLRNPVGADESVLLGTELGDSVSAIGDELGTSLSRFDGDPLGDKDAKKVGKFVGLEVLAVGACVGEGLIAISSNISFGSIR